VKPSRPRCRRISALTVEACTEPGGVLKPGLFATARIGSRADAGVLVPRGVTVLSGTSRVYVVVGDRPKADRHDRRAGRRSDEVARAEAGERVATKNVAQLADGIKVS
jgi:hypothetical protein